MSDRNSLDDVGDDLDPHTLLFGADDDADSDGPVPYMTRADRRHSEQARRKRVHRRGRLIIALTVLLIAVVGIVIVPRIVDHFRVADYSGSGSGAVSFTIPTGATASAIGAILQERGVVKSTEAFTDAADKNSASENIQPGSYTLHRHMSGAAALALLLEPSSRNSNSDIVVTEGATTLDVATRLEKVCGTSAAAVAAALKKPADLGIPVTYKVGAAEPTSAEGFLYPATYTPTSCSKPADVLQTMVSRFIQQDRATNFAADAKAIGLTPYQALIVASIAQSEAKFAADMPKVVRTILNRVNSSAGKLQFNSRLQFDSTSSYACKLAAATTCTYNLVDSPYNTYTHAGLPPTPIDNPGADAMKAAVHPAAGNYLFFVNQDAAGHLFFTNDQNAFTKAAEKCAANHWGCGN